jgi:acyl-CoA synthetase (AMP-forming)/AMP-acid ligase II
LEAGRLREVTTPGEDAAAGSTLTLVGCGSAGLDTRVIIVDAQTREPVPAATIGEVWVQGPSVADGYLGKPSDSQETLHARLASGEGPFLRTGDLGFLRDEELFLVGRSKDVLIIRGRNYHPQDLEWAIGHLHPSLRAGCAAAFVIGEGAEAKLVLAQEARREKDLPVDDIIGNVRETIAEQFGLQVHRVVLAPQGGIPRTSSGKIQRRRCRELFETSALEELGRG